MKTTIWTVGVHCVPPWMVCWGVVVTEEEHSDMLVKINCGCFTRGFVLLGVEYKTPHEASNHRKIDNIGVFRSSVWDQLIKSFNTFPGELKSVEAVWFCIAGLLCLCFSAGRVAHVDGRYGRKGNHQSLLVQLHGWPCSLEQEMQWTILV